MWGIPKIVNADEYAKQVVKNWNNLPMLMTLHAMLRGGLIKLNGIQVCDAMIAHGIDLQTYNNKMLNAPWEGNPHV